MTWTRNEIDEAAALYSQIDASNAHIGKLLLINKFRLIGTAAMAGSTQQPLDMVRSRTPDQVKRRVWEDATMQIIFDRIVADAKNRRALLAQRLRQLNLPVPEMPQ